MCGKPYIDSMAIDIEALMRLQKGWKEPEPLPEPEHPALFSQKRLFRTMAAQVLQEAHLDLASASDGIPLTTALRGYIESVQGHFGAENCRAVAVFHGLSGSTYQEDRQGLITRLDFPVPFNLFGQGGFWDKMRGVNSALPSSSPEPQADVSHTPASLQIGSEVQ